MPQQRRQKQRYDASPLPLCNAHAARSRSRSTSSVEPLPSCRLLASLVTVACALSRDPTTLTGSQTCHASRQRKRSASATSITKASPTLSDSISRSISSSARLDHRLASIVHSCIRSSHACLPILVREVRRELRHLSMTVHRSIVESNPDSRLIPLASRAIAWPLRNARSNRPSKSRRFSSISDVNRSSNRLPRSVSMPRRRSSGRLLNICHLVGVTSCPSDVTPHPSIFVNQKALAIASKERKLDVLA